MKKVFDLIKEQLEEQKQRAYYLASKPGADTATLCGWISATDKALEVVEQVEAECKKNGATMITEYSGFDRGVIGRKLPADSTLNGKKKEYLIELLHTAQHNYEALMWFYNNAVAVNMAALNQKEGAE